MRYLEGCRRGAGLNVVMGEGESEGMDGEEQNEERRRGVRFNRGQRTKKGKEGCRITRVEVVKSRSKVSLKQKDWLREEWRATFFWLLEGDGNEDGCGRRGTRKNGNGQGCTDQRSK